jgi:hypothetical protein
LTDIPKERFKKHYPTIFNWMAQIEGKSLLPREKITAHWSELTTKEKQDLVINYNLYHGRLASKKESAS